MFGRIGFNFEFCSLIWFPFESFKQALFFVLGLEAGKHTFRVAFKDGSHASVEIQRLSEGKNQFYSIFIAQKVQLLN